jgi:hypothetical protein
MGEASESDVERGKKVMYVGIIALVIMLSLWGIVRLLSDGLF